MVAKAPSATASTSLRSASAITASSASIAGRGSPAYHRASGSTWRSVDSPASPAQAAAACSIRCSSPLVRCPIVRRNSNMACQSRLRTSAGAASSASTMPRTSPAISAHTERAMASSPSTPR